MARQDIYDLISNKFDRKKTEALIIDAERFKTYDEVFDRQNLDNIYHLMKRGLIDTLECPISTGKEANVYKANTSEGAAAVKIFRTSTATFRAFLQYIEGDRRFDRIDRSRRGIIYTWARKEYMNLEEANLEGIRVPEPKALHKNILVMGYIDYQGKPAPSLKELDADKEEWSQMWYTVKDWTTRMVKKCKLIHSDLSEYNILYDDDPVFIDLGQAVEYHHPMALEFLKRDLRVISNFFKKKGIKEAEGDSESLYRELSEHVIENK